VTARLNSPWVLRTPLMIILTQPWSRLLQSANQRQSKLCKLRQVIRILDRKLSAQLPPSWLVRLVSPRRRLPSRLPRLPKVKGLLQPQPKRLPLPQSLLPRPPLRHQPKPLLLQLLPTKKKLAVKVMKCSRPKSSSPKCKPTWRRASRRWRTREMPNKLLSRPRTATILLTN